MDDVPLELSDAEQAAIERLGFEFLASFYETALERRPGDLDALADLATVYTQLGRIADGLQLDRGYRMVELLKQGQYKPMPVADQVLSIYAGTQGFLDDVAVDKVQQFEADLLHYIQQHHPDLKKEVATIGKIDPSFRPFLGDSSRQVTAVLQLSGDPAVAVKGLTKSQQRSHAASMRTRTSPGPRGRSGTDSILSCCRPCRIAAFMS